MHPPIQLMQETVETRPMLAWDLLVLDYANSRVLVYDKGQLDQAIEYTKVAKEDIIQCVYEHQNVQHDADVYVINGFTFLLVKDFYRYPIQCSLGKDNPAIQSSKLLYQYYTSLLGEMTEVLDIDTGEIRKFIDIGAALYTTGSCYYDLLKLPITSYRSVVDLEYYVFPVVADSFIFKTIKHFHNWQDYIDIVLDDPLDVLDEGPSIEVLDRQLESIQQMKPEKAIEPKFLKLSTLSAEYILHVLVKCGNRRKKEELFLDKVYFETKGQLDDWYDIIMGKLSIYEGSVDTNVHKAVRTIDDFYDNLSKKLQQ